MGIAERKEREKEEMRTRILDAARRLFAQDGYERTSLRKIAREIEYSPATIYLYFPGGIDEILYALHSDLFRLLFRYMTQEVLDPHPVERLRQIGRGYIRFAREHPDAYYLMFTAKGPMRAVHDAAEWHAAMSTFGLLHETVSDCIASGAFRPADPHLVTFMTWSQVHGAVSLYLHDRMKMYPPEHVDYIMQQSVEHLLESLVVKT